MTERRNNTAHRRGVGVRSAEARRCPACGRGAALVSVTPRPLTPGETTTYCRWDDCTYARVAPSSSDLSRLRDGTHATARAIADTEARGRIDDAANQALIDRLYPPLDSTGQPWRSAFDHARQEGHSEAEAYDFADDYAAYVEDRQYEIRDPDLPIPSPSEWIR